MTKCKDIVNRNDIVKKINHQISTDLHRLPDVEAERFLETHDGSGTIVERKKLDSGIGYNEAIKDIRRRSSGRHEGIDTPSYSDKINTPTSLHWELYNFIIPKLPQTTTVGRAREIIAHLEEEMRVEWVAWKVLKMKVKK